MPNICPLCNSTGNVFHQTKKQFYYQCNNCKGIFMGEELKPNPEKEKRRYLEHNNDVENVNYQNFVEPITSAIMHDYTPTDNGLDFGAGTGPVISKILNDHNYNIQQYDPFFHNKPELLNNKYDYIACCEVIEHFHDPDKEFILLKNLLQPKAKLYCMTDLYDDSIFFPNWYYKNDLTHVFIYKKETIQFIKEKYGFSSVTINNKLVVFSG